MRTQRLERIKPSRAREMDTAAAGDASIARPIRRLFERKKGRPKAPREHDGRRNRREEFMEGLVALSSSTLFNVICCPM